MVPQLEAFRLANELEASKGNDRELDADIAIACYKDNDHEDNREHTHARRVRPSDGEQIGTYWVSSFSGISLHKAPPFSSDKLLKAMALFMLKYNGDIKIR